MKLSMYDAAVPVSIRAMNNLATILEKAAAHADARKLDPAVLIQGRLFPDMFPLARQVQIACDTAKYGPARLAGAEAPAYEDNETNFAELIARARKTAGVPGSVAEGGVRGRRGSYRHLAGTRQVTIDAGSAVSAESRAAQYLLSRDDRVRDPASQRRRARQGGLPGSDVIPEPERRPATGYGLRADELGQQMLMGGVAAASIALIIVLLIFAGFVIAGVLSIVAALVIVALLRLSEWESAPSYLQAYKASVFGIFGLLTWAFLIDHVLPVHEYAWNPQSPFLSHAQLIAHVQQDDWALWPIVPTLLVRFGPGLLICAYLLKRQLRASLAGPVGYLKAVAVSLLGVLTSSYVVAILGVRFYERIVKPENALEIFSPAGAGISSLRWRSSASSAGSLSAIAIFVAMRLMRNPSSHVTPGRAYRTAVIGLFVYLALNTLVLFVYQDVKHLDTALERMLASGDPIGMLFGDSSLFATVRFQDYFLWQLPGLLLSAGIMAARLRGPFLARPVT